MIIVANIIALPVAYFAMKSWLEDFVYRTSIGVWIYIFSAVTAFIIALLTVGFQAVKAGVANPVESLKYEWVFPPKQSVLSAYQWYAIRERNLKF